MAPFLVRIHHHSDAVSWLTPDGKVSQGQLRDAAAQAGSQRLVILVPGEDVLLTAARIPGGRRQPMLQALPYALEEQLASDPEELHFAVGAKSADNTWPVAVVAKAKMQQWLELLSEANIQPESMIPDTLAVPHADGRITVWLDPAGLRVRTGRLAGYAVDPDNLQTALAAELAGHEDHQPQVFCLDLRQEAVPSPCPALAESIAHTREQTSAAPLTVLAQGLHPDLSIDLLQGVYSRAPQWNKTWQYWRTPLALLLTFLLLQGASGLLSLAALRAESRTLSQRIEKVYRTTFPDARQVVNPKAQMEQRLKGLNTGNQAGFLALAAALNPALTQSAGHKILQIRFQNPQLDLTIETPDLRTLEALKQRLAATLVGLEVELKNVSAGRERVQGRLVLEKKEPGS